MENTGRSTSSAFRCVSLKTPQTIENIPPSIAHQPRAYTSSIRFSLPASRSSRRNTPNLLIKLLGGDTRLPFQPTVIDWYRICFRLRRRKRYTRPSGQTSWHVRNTWKKKYSRWNWTASVKWQKQKPLLSTGISHLFPSQRTAFCR